MAKTAWIPKSSRNFLLRWVFAWADVDSQFSNARAARLVAAAQVSRLFQMPLAVFRDGSGYRLHQLKPFRAASSFFPSVLLKKSPASDKVQRLRRSKQVK